MYSATLPTFGGKKDGKKSNDGNEIIRADDPKNKELVKAIINGYKF